MESDNIDRGSLSAIEFKISPTALLETHLANTWTGRQNACLHTQLNTRTDTPACDVVVD